MNEEVLIKVEGVSKKFCRDFKRSLWYGMKDIGRSLLGRDHSEDALRKDEFWAVKDISFEVRRGECLGLIGHNGAGKSTLLKMLNGLINPDQGKITMRGRIGALIELGAGFNPLLTGRENIYNNGAVLGFTKREINEKFDAIVDFSEIGKFIDAPVQNYSSGMKVRLGFAVAAQMEPDILIIDEVLAVGDMSFRLKCLKTIDQLLENSAIIFVSHAMPQISRVSNKLLLIEKGIQLFIGNDISKGIDIYYSKLIRHNNDCKFKTDNCELIEIKVLSGVGIPPQINRLDDIEIKIQFKITNIFIKPVIGVTIYDNEQKPIGIASFDEGIDEKNIFKKEHGYDYYSVLLIIPRNNLSKGMYNIAFYITEKPNFNPLLRIQNVTSFTISSKKDVYPPIELEGYWH